VILGERNVWTGSGAKRRLITKEDNVFYIPILKTLQVLLNNETLLSEVIFLCCVYNCLINRVYLTTVNMHVLSKIWLNLKVSLCQHL